MICQALQSMTIQFKIEKISIVLLRKLIGFDNKQVNEYRLQSVVISDAFFITKAIYCCYTLIRPEIMTSYHNDYGNYDLAAIKSRHLKSCETQRCFSDFTKTELTSGSRHGVWRLGLRRLCYHFDCLSRYWSVSEWFAASPTKVIKTSFLRYARFSGGRQKTNEEYLMANRSMPIW